MPATPDHAEDTKVSGAAVLDVDGHPPLSITHLSQHNNEHRKPNLPLEWIVVRIEVTDTGYGIKPRDMTQSKLFCESVASIVSSWPLSHLKLPSIKQSKEDSKVND